MKKRNVFFIALAIFVVTRKKYYIKNFSIFIPNTSLLGIKSKTDTLQQIKKNIQINWSNGSWIITIKPVYGFKIPYEAILPATAPLAIPQLIAQIGNNIKIEDVKKLGILVGRELIIKGVSFYA